MCIAIFQSRRRSKEAKTPDYSDEWRGGEVLPITIPRMNYLIYTRFIKYFDDGKLAKYWFRFGGESLDPEYMKYHHVCYDMIKFLGGINRIDLPTLAECQKSKELNKACLALFSEGRRILRKTVQFRSENEVTTDVYDPETDANRIVKLTKKQLEKLNKISASFEFVRKEVSKTTREQAL
jgi:hypothetical protein